VLVIELQLKRETAKLWEMGIISGASQHPKDVLFVRDLVGTYGLGAISPRKSPNSGYFTARADLIV